MDSNKDKDPSGVHHISVSEQYSEVDDNRGVATEPTIPRLDTVNLQPSSELEQPPVTPISHPKAPSNLNKYFLYTLVGGLVISALISVGAVLVGEFNTTLSRALSTTVSMVGHTLFALLLVSVSSKNKGKSESLLINMLVLVTIASFITSLLGIWQVIEGRLVYDLYMVYLYTLCASLWTFLLFKVGANLLDKPTRITSLVSIGLTALFYGLLLPTAFTHYPDRLPEFYYRVMAATAILLATASVIIIVFRRIHIAKHHEIKVSVVPKTPWDIIIAVVVLVFGLPTIFSLISTLSSYNSSYTSTGDYVSTNQAEDLEKQKQDKQEFGTDCSNLGGSFAQNLIPYRSRSVVSKITPTTTTTSPSTDISLKDEGGGEVHAVVNSSQIKLFDIDCNIIDPSTLREGDAVVYYMDSSNSSFAALQIVAKNTN